MVHVLDPRADILGAGNCRLSGILILLGDETEALEERRGNGPHWRVGPRPGKVEQAKAGYV